MFDHNVIFFVVGHNIAKLKLKEKIYSYIEGNENCAKICTISLSSNKDLLAVAEINN